MNHWSKLDLLGSRVHLRYNMSTKVKTSFGGIISTFTAIILGTLLYGFGQDFFKRTNPTFIPRTISPATYPFWNITNQNFSYAFTLEDTDGIPQKDRSLFYWSFRYERYQKNEQGDWEIKNYDELNTTLCTPEMFGDPQKFIDKQLNSWHCPVLNNIRVGGYWDSGEVAYLRIDVLRCLEGKFNPFTKEPCGKNKDSLAKIYKKYFYSSILQSVLVNPANYDKPLEGDYVTKYKMLNDGFLKRDIFFFKEYIINTDYGWIIKTNREFKILGVDAYENDILNLDPKAGGNMHFETRIYFDKKQESFIREYVKVQKLAAEVGGILKLFITVAYVLTEYFNDFWVNYDLANHFISKDEVSTFRDYFASKILGSNKSDKINDKVVISKINPFVVDVNLSSKIKPNSEIQFQDNSAYNFKPDNVNYSSIFPKNNDNYKLKKIRAARNNYEKGIITGNEKSEETNNKQSNLIYQNNMYINNSSNNNVVNPNNSNNNFEFDDKVNNCSKFLPKDIKKDLVLLNNRHESNNFEMSSGVNINVNKEKDNQSINNIDLVESVRIIVKKMNLFKNKSTNSIVAKQDNKFMSFYSYLWISTPHIFKCTKNIESQLKRSLVYSSNSYLDTLISIESLIDSRFLLNKVKEILFNKDQLHLINYLPNREFENFFKNRYRDNEQCLFNSSEPNKFTESKSFIMALRKNASPQDENNQIETVRRVLKDSVTNNVDARLIEAFKL